MSDLFEDREKALENKYAREEDLRFEIDSSAIRLFGLWAANQLGYKNASAIEYANKIYDIYVREQGLPNAIRFIKDCFTAKGLLISEERLRSLFNLYEERARRIVGRL